MRTTMHNPDSMDDQDARLDRQRQAWLDGGRPAVEEFLNGTEDSGNADLLLDLIYNEIVTREELGEYPALEQYLERYPHLAEELRLHFEVHQAVRGEILGNGAEEPEGEQAIQSGPIEDLLRPERAPSLAGYELLGELGRGGMGVVYKARHRRLRRFVAIKMFQPGRKPSGRELARFRAEAEAIARLQHPNIVEIFEIGEENGLPFLALELAGQGTLQQRLRDLPMGSEAVALLMETLARAIQHAHENRIVHRDLKPANVLFTDEETPKITDFGLAKLLEEEEGADRDVTRTGDPIGTPRYMSPEQANGRVDLVGPATDIHGLGTLMYECMTGQAPFVAPSVVETLDKVRHEDPLPPRRLQRSIPRDLETICLKCLRKDPWARYGSARELAEDLKRYRTGVPILARRASVAETGWKWCRRNPGKATAFASLAFACLALGGFLVYSGYAERVRIARLKEEITALVKEGQLELGRGDARLARERFQQALTKVQGEASLDSHELGIRGWLDHSIRQARKLAAPERRAPPSFEERRDEALLLRVLCDPKDPKKYGEAREALASCLEFTPADEPVWRSEREFLLVVLAELDWRNRGEQKALEWLMPPEELSTRLGLTMRGHLLDKLQRREEAEASLAAADKLVVQEEYERLFTGVVRLGEGKPEEAVRELDLLLREHPDNHTARLLAMLACLRGKAPREAGVGLTACIGDRPDSPLGYLLRAEACLDDGDRIGCARDLSAALDRTRNGVIQGLVETTRDRLLAEVARMEPEPADKFWRTEVKTGDGTRAIRDIGLFNKNKPAGER